LVHRYDNIKIDLKETGYGLNSADSGYGLVAAACGNGNSPSGSIKHWEYFYHQVSASQ
jgi:hypothetical protein